jgi:hypothetical protein
MLQADRNWLFNKAYELDNAERIWTPKDIRVVPAVRVEKLRIQDRTGDLAILFTEAQLALLAEGLRELAANDEIRVFSNDCKPRYR